MNKLLTGLFAEVADLDSQHQDLDSLLKKLSEETTMLATDTAETI